MKICPKCGSTKFMAKICKAACVVEQENHWNIVSDSEPEISIIGCFECNEEFSEDQLIDGDICKQCGKPVAKDYLSNEGICESCQLETMDSDLKNASREELLHILLMERRNHSAVQNHISSAKEAAKATEKKAETTESETKKSAKNTTEKTRPRNKKSSTKEKSESSKIPSETSEQTVPDVSSPISEPMATDTIQAAATVSPNITPETTRVSPVGTATQEPQAFVSPVSSETTYPSASMPQQQVSYGAMDYLSTLQNSNAPFPENPQSENISFYQEPDLNGDASY